MRQNEEGIRERTSEEAERILEKNERHWKEIRRASQYIRLLRVEMKIWVKILQHLVIHINIALKVKLSPGSA